MFQVLKRELNIVEVLEALTDIPYKLIGENTFVPEDDTCPVCGHKDCFRVKHEGDNSESFAKCFSEDKIWDVTSITADLLEVSNVEAAKKLAEEYKIELPKTGSPVQEAFNKAGEYYHAMLLEVGPYPELNGLTPLEYQEQVRKHNPEILSELSIGWSDGNCRTFLENSGIDYEIIKDSGLLGKKGDYLPSKCFIYPHFIKGKVSHFTFKDPSGRLAYQLPNKYKLNNHSFYNSDSTQKSGPVIVVEGENDVVSILEAGWLAPVICCNGSISTAQIEWMALELEGRDVITIFDSDAAGDKYREKVQRIKSKFLSLISVRIDSGVKDIDEYLKAGGSLTGLIDSFQDSSETGEEVTVLEGSSVNSNIVVQGGAYYKKRFMDGEEKLSKLSNFTIMLQNIYIQNNNRDREVVIIREDGQRSGPCKVSSEAKVSLKPFKTLIANAVDATFYGREEDLSSMWEHVYTHSKERIVYLPSMVGRNDEFKGWLFNDCFISDDGNVLYPNEDGVIWIKNQSVGIKPIPIVSSPDSTIDTGIPNLRPSMEEEERKEFIKEFILTFGTNLGELGDSITIMAWFYMSLFVKPLFPKLLHFPFLYLWGETQKGKSTIVTWLMNFFDMDRSGTIMMDTYGSGVSFSRKISFYASLPLCVDEMRTADAKMVELNGVFRRWYDRKGRSVAKGDTNVTDQPVRSTFMLSGQDQFKDAATRSRAIPIRIGKSSREIIHSYAWISDRAANLHNVGFQLIMNSLTVDFDEMWAKVLTQVEVLREGGISSRTSILWGLIYAFSLEIIKDFGIDFDYHSYILATANEDYDSQKEETLSHHFWNIAEGLQTAQNPILTGEHFRREKDTLYVWYIEVFRLIDRALGHHEEKFSASAIREAIREEPYYIESCRVGMGVNDVQRRVIALDLTKAPTALQNIGSYLG